MSRTPLGAAEAPLRWHVVVEDLPASGFDPATHDYLDLIDET